MNLKLCLSAVAVVALTSCGGSDSDSSGGGNNADARTMLEERIITGRNIITSNPWTCEFLDDQGNAQFTDEYEFLIDRSGTASDGFFTWSASSADTISVDDNVGGQPGSGMYTIGAIVFESVAFTDDRFTATLDGTYFEDAVPRTFPLRCQRDGPAIF